MLNNRPSRDATFLTIARTIARRSTCIRAQVGAVVTDAAGLQILGLGYNGAPRGLPNGCARATPGDCGCVHAELNALLKAPGAVPEKVLYATTAPCERCAAAICNAGIARVVYAIKYRSDAGSELLVSAGIVVSQM